MSVHVLVLAFALLGAQEIDDASLARVRAGIERSKLNLELPKADFRILIETRPPLADIFELPPWVTPPDPLDAPKVGGRTAGGSVDPGKISHAISKAIRTRRAHAEVMDAIREYCAAHRDEPGASGICGGTPR